VGMYVGGGDYKADYSEADWKKLEKSISRSFNKLVAKRNVVGARIEWYKRHWNINGISKFMLVQLKRYQTNISNSYLQINNQAWNVFKYISDKKILKGYIKWMRKLVELYPKSYIMLDTYANLLYKIGRHKEAIVWEQRAIDFSQGLIRDSYSDILEKMIRGEPTWSGCIKIK